MNPVDALRIIRQRAVQSAQIFPCGHARKQMRKRKIDLLQIQRGLLRGHIVEGPYRDIGTGQWRCNVEATISGDTFTVVVEIPDEPHLEVVTTF